jgi:microcystin-dependent protein
VAGEGSTRRGFLQRGAGLAAAAVVGTAGLEAPRALARRSDAIDAFPGEIRLFAGDWVPTGWLPCRGGEFDRDKYPALAKAIGNAFGVANDGQFDLPDLRGRALLGSGDPPGGQGERIGKDGDGLCAGAEGDDPATLGIMMLISPGIQTGRQMIGEIRPFALGYAPKDWLVCDGSQLKIRSNTAALFSVCGDKFGGDGRDTFELPDLRGFTPVGAGDGPGLPATPPGSRTRGLAPERGDRPPRLHFTHCIATQGQYPGRD